ncbi:hypothetical protein GCM10010277_55890 [Streptomyces longisporoflavus]|uniref:DUF397 domain-containing protein n=1 Tax=Streptomyces longisporoflavus TaxID=28044 RepID=UPI00167EE67C|nr:DUF397 domain-containing protein [Streptomyces longisporoflavus]GGV55462.1 hypothetical protein GCM10010277_55890 [Streptomyces longisporoflavus]
MPSLNWQKSSYSGGPESNCLYIATAPDGTIRLRESDAPDTVLTTTPGPLAALLETLSTTGRSRVRG